MRIICLSLLFASFMVFFDSCQVCSCKKVPCPAFNDPEFINWFPYAVYQKIIFSNNSLTDTITIDHLDRSVGYEANKGCFHSASGCAMNYYLSSQEILSNYSSKFFLGFSSQTPFESSVTTKGITLKFYNFICNGSDVNSQGLELNTGIYSSQYHPSLTIAGHLYNNVQVVTKDTTSVGNKTGGVYKIFLAKNQGMIGYEDYPALSTWIKQ